MTSALRERVTAAEEEERRRALRVLLQRPLLTAAGERDTLLLVRRHAVWLQDWLRRHPGWHLHIDHELARLAKTPSAIGDRSHPARDPRHHQPFSRRRYVLLCLALSHCERAGRQTTLKRLCEYLQGTLHSDAALSRAGMELDPQRREDRGDLVAVGRYLCELQVIARVHGDEESYLAGSGDCLYAIRRAVLGRLLAVRRGPSQISEEDPARRLLLLQAEATGAGEDNRRRAVRQRLVRLLLERPVLYLADLTEEERAYFASQRHFLLRELVQATGLVAEIRAEGVALVDPEGELTDFRLPQEGTTGHAALLLAEWLVERRRADGAQAWVPMAAIEAHLAACARSHGGRWRRDAGTPEGAVALAQELVARLADLDLVRLAGGAPGTAPMVRPLPALARYALTGDAADGHIEEQGDAAARAAAQTAGGVDGHVDGTQQELFP